MYRRNDSSRDKVGRMSNLTYEQLVEKAAKAIYDHFWGDLDDDAPMMDWKDYKEYAAIVIAVIYAETAEPTEEMIEAGAQRLVSCGEEPATWPDSYDPLDVAATRQQAERVLLSGLAASPLNPEGK